LIRVSGYPGRGIPAILEIGEHEREFWTREKFLHLWRCQARTPIETFLDGKKSFVEKNLNEGLVA
jgi:hypothetical protein